MQFLWPYIGWGGIFVSLKINVLPQYYLSETQKVKKAVFA